MQQDIQFFESLKDLNCYLQDKPYKYINTNLFNLFYCNEKIAMKKYKSEQNQIIRMWRTNTFLDIWYTDFPCIRNDQFIALINYSLSGDSIKINNITLNDFDFAVKMGSNNCLNATKERELRLSIMHYMIIIAINNNKRKIVVNTHRNMIEYNTIYYDYGFKLTNRKIDDNMFEIEFYLY